MWSRRPRLLINSRGRLFHVFLPSLQPLPTRIQKGEGEAAAPTSPPSDHFFGTPYFLAGAGAGAGATAARVRR